MQTLLKDRVLVLIPKTDTEQAELATLSAAEKS